LGATTGEGMALSADEAKRLVEVAADTLAGAAPLVLGVSGAITARVLEAVEAAAALPVAGYLIASPYYVRPSQEGLRRHFEAIADATDRGVILYNIPYRTGVNLSNETMLALAGRVNIVGVKDCCADPAQSADLIRRRPEGFAVLTGEDGSYAEALGQGADGAILASAHIDPEGFRALHRLAQAGRRDELAADWARLRAVPRLLFREPSPAGLKHWLWRVGLIDSPELRLPMVPASAALAADVERLMPARADDPVAAPVPAPPRFG
ncbi:MAG TPA: dihydrodipicolinate synthase family protein, partial [Caulobacteraceae bacterium]|nr:dihydrodipicolinate synthase family protein [Caulobacteraceae bacterium]